jgi:hypothetical protein
MGLLRVGFSKYCSAVRAEIEQPYQNDLAWDMAAGAR